MANALLIHFSDKSGSLSARRETLKALAEKLGTSETKAVHIAINRLYIELTQGDIEYDFPTEEQLKQMNHENIGEVRVTQSIF